MKRRSTLGILVSICMILSLVSIACKKEEPKETAQEPTKAAESVPQPQGLFMAQITVDSVPEAAKAGTTLKLSVKVKNLSNAAWPAKGSNPVRLSYHWSDAATGKAVVWDGKRTSASKDVAPGEEAALKANVETPNTKGSYVLELDIVQEGVAWFGKKGSETSKHTVAIK